jgi:methanogenic corrinoid protein MtbC1
MEELLNDLRNTLSTYDKNEAFRIVRLIIEKGKDPIEVINFLTTKMVDIGNRFAKYELFLPDLVGAGDIMQSILPILESEIKKKGLEVNKLGTVVLGTVQGDIHSIGKDLVNILLKAEGFNVIDLGVDNSASNFIKAVKDYNADILAMSALLTTTANEQKKVIESLVSEGIRHKVKVIVGGGAITEDFAVKIGADGYESTAPGAAKIARNLLKK